MLFRNAHVVDVVASAAAVRRVTFHDCRGEFVFHEFFDERGAQIVRVFALARAYLYARLPRRLVASCAVDFDQCVRRDVADKIDDGS